MEIRREGNALILTPVRKSWTSFAEVSAADPDFLSERETVIKPDRVSLE